MLTVAGGEEWREAVGATFYALAVDRIAEDFAAQVNTTALGRGVQVSTVTSSANALVRPSRLVRQSPSDDLLLLVQLAGRTTVRQEDREVVLEGGAATLCDPLIPYAVTAHTAAQQIVVMLPRDVLRGLAVPVEGLRLRLLRPDSLALRALVGVAIPAAGTDAPPSFVESDAVGVTVADLSRALFMSASEAGARPVGVEATLRAIQVCIQDRAADPRFDVTALAAATGVSVRRLSTVLGDDVSPAELIRRERLHRARRQLGDVRDADLSVAEVARRSGFADATTFTRAFRREYGDLPSEVRASSLGVR